MTASSSALAKVCMMAKSDMDLFLAKHTFGPTKKSFFNKEVGETITYLAYNSYEVVKAVNKHNTKVMKAKMKLAKKAKKQEEDSRKARPIDCSKDDYDDLPF